MEPAQGAVPVAGAELTGAQGHRGAIHVPRRADIAGVLAPRLREGDIVITLGAGDVWQVGEEILQGLRVNVASG